jgi:hypothetical protein
MIALNIVTFIAINSRSGPRGIHRASPPVLDGPSNAANGFPACDGSDSTACSVRCMRGARCTLEALVWQEPLPCKTGKWSSCTGPKGMGSSGHSVVWVTR